jgi:hypothetical protein
MMQFAYIMGTSFAKLRLFFHKVTIFSIFFPPLRETLYADPVKLFAEELLCLLPVSFSALIKQRT